MTKFYSVTFVDKQGNLKSAGVRAESESQVRKHLRETQGLKEVVTLKTVG